MLTKSLNFAKLSTALALSAAVGGVVGALVVANPAISGLKNYKLVGTDGWSIVFDCKQWDTVTGEGKVGKNCTVKEVRGGRGGIATKE